MCAKFQVDQSMFVRVKAVFVFVWKEEKKEEKKLKLWSLVPRKWLAQFTSNLKCSLLLYRWALPQQIWCSLDKRSWIYESVKIATFLFLLINTPTCTHYRLRAPRASWAVWHYHVSWYQMYTSIRVVSSKHSQYL